MSVSTNNRLQINTNYIDSPDSALNVTNAILSTVIDYFRDSLKDRINIAGGLVDKIESVNGLLSRVITRTGSKNTPVTPTSLNSTPKTNSDLSSLFLSDGPNLGNNLADANDLFDQLNNFGVNLNAPVMTPVLTDLLDKDGKVISSSFSWVSLDSTKLDNLPDGGSTDYPGAYTKLIDFGTDNQKVKFTIFDQYSNRRSTQDDLFTALGSISNVANNLDSQLESELAKAKITSDKIDQQLQDIQNTSKSDSEKLKNNYSNNQDILSEIRRKFRTVKYERELLLTNKLSEITSVNFNENLTNDEIVNSNINPIDESKYKTLLAYIKKITNVKIPENNVDNELNMQDIPFIKELNTSIDSKKD